jgi:fumarate reductase subunit C
MRNSTTPAVQQAKRWYWQRISAMVLALLVLVHLAVMVYAVRGGLSAAEILSRTEGSWLFAGFYAVFVLACAVHVPVGLANIAREWWGWSAHAALWASRGFAVLLLVLGLRAVWGVVMPGAGA